MSRAGERLGRRFYKRPSTTVARALLGQVLVRATRGGGRLTARIVETEAYAQDDPASHSFRGRTARNAVMFGEPGHLYVYFTYGMHFCANVVTGRPGEGSAVLLRAAEPLEGVRTMARRRGTADPRSLCSGPARLCQAFGIVRGADGLDLVDGGRTWIERGRPIEDARVVVGPRIGIREGLDRAWRFRIDGDGFVSRTPARQPGAHAGRAVSIASRP